MSAASSYGARAHVLRPRVSQRRRLGHRKTIEEHIMGHSSLVGTTTAPQRPQGTDEQALGPSDSTDSGSDTLGAGNRPAADPGEPVDVTLNRDQALAPIEDTGEDGDETEPADIATDRIIDATDVEPIDRDLNEGELAKPGRG
jgi:hypothetical protein